MKRLQRVLAVVAVLFLANSCFGKFALVRNLYQFNEEIENGVARSAVFWALVIIPVYQLAAIGDFWVLNVAEFWTGENPMELPEEPGATVRVSQASRDVLQLRVSLPDGRVEELELVRMGERAGAVRAADGRILSAVEQLEDGSIAVTTAGTVRVVRAEEIEALAARIGSGGLLSAARDLLWGERVVAQR